MKVGDLAKDKRPAFQFYPGDWLKDADLGGCSPAARGVWMDVLCLMFECDERGVLISNGLIWDLLKLSRVVRGDSTANLAVLRELEGAGVLHRRKDGAYCSARLVRDERLRQVRARAGCAGGKATQAPVESVQHVSKRQAKGQAKPKQKVPPSSSSSSSPSGNIAGKPASNLKRPPRSRSPDPVWDVIVELWYPDGVAPGQKTHVGKLVRDFKFFLPEHQDPAGEIRRRHRIYGEMYPTMSNTAEAVSKQWGRIGEHKPYIDPRDRSTSTQAEQNADFIASCRRSARLKDVVKDWSDAEMLGPAKAALVYGGEKMKAYLKQREKQER